MALQVEWAESALNDLLEQLEFIARDSSSYAAALSLKAEHAASTLDRLPHRGRVVPEYQDANVREIPVGNYRLIYRVQETKILILAFVHAARDLGALFDDERGPANWDG